MGKDIGIVVDVLQGVKVLKNELQDFESNHYA